MRNIHCNSKFDAHKAIIDYFFPTKQNLICIEFGRLRSATQHHKMGDGWSTYQYVLHPKIGMLYSVDCDLNTEKACRELIKDGLLKKIVFLWSSSQLNPEIKFDYCFVDGPDEPNINFNLYKSVESRLKDGAIVAIDDYNYRIKTKIFEKYMPEHGYEPFLFSDILVFNKKMVSVV